VFAVDLIRIMSYVSTYIAKKYFVKCENYKINIKFCNINIKFINIKFCNINIKFINIKFCNISYICQL